MRKYSDYNSYLVHVKNCKIINTTISDLTRVYDAKLNTCCAGAQQNDYLTQTQNLYISTEPNYTVASLNFKNSLIVKPIDAGSVPQYNSIFSLPCDSTTINGLEKKITNTCSVGETQRIFMYSINKVGAAKLLAYIQQNGIKHGIDYLMKICPQLISKEIQPQIAFSEWVETNDAKVDSDIQKNYETFDFDKFINKTIIFCVFIITLIFAK